MIAIAPRKSSIEKLRSLPACFTDKTFARLFNMSMAATQVSLHRMKEAGLIDTAGVRSGVYFNLIADPNAKDTYAVDALLHVYPTAVLMGESVLHAAGWITQIPSAISVVVIQRPSYQSLEGFSVRGRPIEWFKSHASKFISPEAAEFNTYGLKSLPPVLALADLYANEGFVFDADDLDIPDDKTEDIAQAFADFGVGVPESYPLVCKTQGFSQRI